MNMKVTRYFFGSTDRGLPDAVVIFQQNQTDLGISLNVTVILTLILEISRGDVSPPGLWMMRVETLFTI